MFLLKLFVLLLSVLGSISWEESKLASDSIPLLGALQEEEYQDIRQQPAATKLLIQKYERDLNASRILQKDDKKLMLNWTDEFQIKKLDVTMKYRLQMVRHQEHSFKSNGNVKWIDCLYIHRKEIRQSIRYYHDNEHECLKTTSSKDAESKEDVELLEKQINKWRKGYRFLVNLCRNENPRNEKMAQQCLITYMQNDNYDEVIQRLMLLKQGAMSDLYAYYNASLIDLEECLRSQLSKYLDRIRSVMDTLNKCYSLTT